MLLPPLPNISFEETIAHLKAIKPKGSSSPKNYVVISGAGPAGLTRAIISVLKGYKTTVFEKRDQNHEIRLNTITLNAISIALLNKIGVLDYLRKEKLIHTTSETKIDIRLGDLEKGLKAVLTRITKKKVIYYNAHISVIHTETSGNIRLDIKQANGQTLSCREVEILSINEGTHSHTANLLGISRTQLLPKIPLITAIFKNTRPKVQNLSTLLIYVTISISNLVINIYYLSLFLFKFLFQKESPFNPKRKIGGSIILSTPGQKYLGYSLSKEESETLLRLKTKTELLKKQLAEDQPNNRAALQGVLQQQEQHLQAYIRKWSYLSYYFTTLLAIIDWVNDLLNKTMKKPDIHWWPPLDTPQCNMIEVEVDKASSSCGAIGQALYLIGGDTLATADPSTGLGCNIALETASYFEEVLYGIKNKIPPSQILEKYSKYSTSMVDKIHQQSLSYRQLYRPDT